MPPGETSGLEATSAKAGQMLGISSFCDIRQLVFGRLFLSRGLQRGSSTAMLLGRKRYTPRPGSPCFVYLTQTVLSTTLEVSQASTVSRLILPRWRPNGERTTQVHLRDVIWIPMWDTASFLCHLLPSSSFDALAHDSSNGKSSPAGQYPV